MAEFCPVVEQIIKDTDWLQSSGFDTIHYVMRFGAERQLTIECRIRARYQELEVSSQESMARLHDVFLDRRQLRRFLAAEVNRVFSYIQSEFRLPENAELFSFLAKEAVNAEQGAPADGGGNAPPRLS